MKRTLLILCEGQSESAFIIEPQKIGLDRMRERCPHFNEWVNSILMVAENT